MATIENPRLHESSEKTERSDEESGAPRNPITIDPETNRRLLRKIDWRLMPIVCSGLALVIKMLADETVSCVLPMPYR